MKFIVVVILLAATGAARAEDEGRWYLGGSFGASSVKNPCPAAPATVSCSTADPAFKLALGYQANRRFGVELAYANLGSITRRDRRFPRDTSGNVDLAALELSALGAWPLAERLDLQVRLGPYLSASFEPVQVDEDSSSSVAGGGATFGLGLRYRASDDLFIRFEWQRYSSFPVPVPFEASGATATIDTLTLGFVFLLGGR